VIPILGSVSGLYLLLVAVVFIFQKKLLYFPDTNRPEDHLISYSELTFWPNSDNYRGFIAKALPENARGTVIVFHGNAGRAVERTDYVQALGRLGWRVVLAEYPGFGGRPGSLSEKSLTDDGRETVCEVHQKFGGPVYVLGESLGAGVACSVASDPTLPLDGLILITPWDSLPEVAQSTFWFLPARFLVRDRFDSVRNLAHFQKPVAILLSERDEVIPTARGQRLYDSLLAPKRRWVFPGAGHNTWPSGPREAWWREVSDFMSGKIPS
jgi:uncharacterized protein